MPEVIAPVEEVGALVMTLAGSGLQVKRTLGAAPGATQSLITWNDATGDVTLRSGPEGASTLHLLSATVSIDALLTVTQIATFVTAIRLPGNSAAALQARNAANTAWVDLMYLGAGDTAVIPRALSTQTLTATQVTANAGVQIGGPAALATTATALLSYEAPITRIYIGDGTGYSTRFAKRAAGATTDLVYINDTGAVSIIGSLTVMAATAPFAIINSQSGAATDTQQLHFTRNGVTQWRIGNNITATNVDLFELYNEGVGTAFAVNRTDRMVTFYGGISVQGGPFSAGTISKNSIYGMLIGGSVGTQYDFGLVTPAGGNILVVPTGTADLITFGNLAVTKSTATLTVHSTGSNDAYITMLGGAGTSRNWRIGKDVTVANDFEIHVSVTNGGVDFAPALTMTNSGLTTLFSQSGAQLMLATTTGGVGGTQQLLFKNDTNIIWRIGNNIDASNVNSLTVWNEGYGAIMTFGKATGVVTISAALFVSGQIVAPDLSTNSGGVDLTFHNGATLLATFSATNNSAVFSTSGNFQNIVTVNRGSAASLLGYYGVFRLGNPVYYFGTNGADSGCILNSAATQDIIAWTNAGDLSLAGTLNVQGSAGLAIGGVNNRRRIQSTGVNSFNVLGDANGFADWGVLSLLLAPAGIAAPIDGQLWTNGASLFIRLSGVTRTVTVT